MKTLRALLFSLAAAPFAFLLPGCSSGGGGGSQAPSNPVVSPPVVTSISPTTVLAGSSAFTLTVNGSNFQSNSVIEVNGVAEATSFVSAVQLTAALPASALATGATLNVIVATGSQTSTSTMTLTVTNPIPTLSSISPSTLPVGLSKATTITVTGTNFTSGTAAQFNGLARPTMVVSSTQLTFQLTVADQANIQNASITVQNSAPGGGTSSAAALALVPATGTPTITTISPTQLWLNSATTIQISGTNFLPASVVEWNGTSLPTQYDTFTIGGTTYVYLFAVVPANLLTAVGSAGVTVHNPTALADSNAVTVSIVNPPTPTITSISPGGGPLNTMATLTITGTGFTQNSTVQIDGLPVVSTFLSATRLTTQVAGTTLSLPGNHAITVTTPAPGGGTSNAGFFTAYIALPNNGMALNPVNGLLYVSVPGSAGPPYGNSVVSVDPATGALGKPIYVGSEPDALAISSDGTTLWVALDGASAIRQVNLTTGTAGMQFSLAGNVGPDTFPPIVHAVAVLPGTTNSIVASVPTNNASYEDLLTIYDNGVARSATAPISMVAGLPGIFVNPAKAEVYVYSNESGYQVLSYNASGLTHLAGNSGLYPSSGSSGRAVQVDAGNAYLDSGMVLAAETGTVLGSFYSNGTVVAAGPMISDSTLGKNFILEYTSTPSQLIPTMQIQVFNESTLAAFPGAIIPVAGPVSGAKYGAGIDSETEPDGVNPVDTMVRWGSNGLAFRAANGIFSLRSNLVKDLSSVNADLGVSVSAPATVATGSNFTVIATITNNGPSAATNAAASVWIPVNATLISVAPSTGSCAAAVPVMCSLGNLANGSSVTITMTLTAVSPGSAATTATVSAGENDPANTNNSAGATTAISGSAYSAVPVVTSLSPNVAQAGTNGVTLIVNGSGFTSNSTVLWSTTPLNTSYQSATQLTAFVSPGLLANMGWAAVTVSTPSPGGGTSNVLPFSIFSTVSLAANHILYDPYSRLLYASVNSSSSTPAGNSLITVDPNTRALGTPAAAGLQPGKMAETDDGNYLYVNLNGANAVGRFNVATQHLDFSFPVSGTGPSSFGTLALRDISVLPGSETTIAVDMGSSIGTAIYDVNPAAQTATTRVRSNGQNSTGIYTGSNPQFLNTSTLFTFDLDTTASALDQWAVTSTGLSGSSTQQYGLNSFLFTAFKLRKDMAYSDGGGVANLDLTPPAPAGVFLPVMSNTGVSDQAYYFYASGQINEPDTSQGLSFFALPGTISGSSGVTPAVALNVFDERTFMELQSITVPLSATGSPAPKYLDLLRCDQDELALLRSDGVIMLFKGAIVVPGLLTQNAAATLSTSSTLTHGTGNTILTLTGTGFLPGTAVMWNGSYRTTTLVNSTQITVALPASDVATAGAVSVTAVNPGSASSNVLTVTIQ